MWHPLKEAGFTKSILGMETEKREQPKSQSKGVVGVKWWKNASKTKSVKFVIILSTIHAFEIADSSNIDRWTGAVIKKPDVIMDYNSTVIGVNLVGQV